MRQPDILFINPNLLKPPIAPLGIDMLNSFLQSRHIETELLDLNPLYQDDLENRIMYYFSESNPLLIGISIRNLDDSSYPSMKFTLENTKTIIRLIRKYTTTPCVLGGVGFSLMPEAVMRELGAEYGITGDGEEPLYRLIMALKQGDRFPSIPGLFVVKGNTIESTPPVFGEIPEYISHRFVDNRWYFAHGGQIGIETKRGCDGTCIYCADPVAKGKKIRLRSPEDVIVALKAFVDEGITCFHTCDSEFNRPLNHAIAICDALIASGINKHVSLYAYCSPLPFTIELGKKMALAGFTGINFGIDHMNDMILNRLGRDHTSKDVLTVTETLKQKNIRIMYDLLLCSPYETEETLREVIEKTRSSGADCIGISMGVRLYPNTPLYQLVKKEKSEFFDGERGDPPLRPFYFARPKKERAIPLLCELIGDDRRFFFQPLGEKHNYNYADNNRLLDAIEKGARGAYWDILRSL
jgi:radical SAM superfamily enzyme YgiQ (UPF0313 family)